MFLIPLEHNIFRYQMPADCRILGNMAPTAPAPRERFTLPVTAAEADALAEKLGQIATATGWQRAALVYARVKVSGHGGDRSKINIDLADDRMTAEQYAMLGVHGLSSATTVRRYWRCWDHAVDDGLVEPVGLGDEAELPDAGFDEYFTAPERGPWWDRSTPANRTGPEPTKFTIALRETPQPEPVKIKVNVKHREESPQPDPARLTLVRTDDDQEQEESEPPLAGLDGMLLDGLEGVAEQLDSLLWMGEKIETYSEKVFDCLHQIFQKLEHFTALKVVNRD